jgi:hypothetical protein
MRFGVRFSLGVLLLSGLSVLPAKADSRRALGVVVQTDHGHIDTTNAVTGADIYSCDSLDTDDGGVLRVKVGASQIFLSSSSAAALEDEGSAIQALAASGTIDFAISAAQDLSVRTRAGIIRGTGNQAASGQVAYKGPQELIISAVHGDLLLDDGGELRTIPEGKSADVTFDENLDDSCRNPAAADQTNQGVQRAFNARKIGFYLLAGTAAAIPAYFIWHSAAVSDSTPAK